MRSIRFAVLIRLCWCNYHRAEKALRGKELAFAGDLEEARMIRV